MFDCVKVKDWALESLQLLPRKAIKPICTMSYSERANASSYKVIQSVVVS